MQKRLTQHMKTHSSEKPHMCDKVSSDDCTNQVQSYKKIIIIGDLLQYLKSQDCSCWHVFFPGSVVTLHVLFS